ncbi:hypothetical protein E2C01_071787 [Portunus trituberculatus]|uniref:Uncharacterized protein n=1 Tax=Portunus trituberculatus TaxID=210409 RepID=A0A5B7I5C7_PORTR|nr:hypothetical protein [Portunus trituberculatus]
MWKCYQLDVDLIRRLCVLWDFSEFLEMSHEVSECLEVFMGVCKLYACGAFLGGSSPLVPVALPGRLSRLQAAQVDG